jgi:hypothetical protein
VSPSASACESCGASLRPNTTSVVVSVDLSPGTLTNPKRFNRATVAYPGNVIAALRAFLTDPPITGESWIWWH